MLYPQYFIDDLKNRADLVRVVEKHVRLKKKGANWMACCPFHEEKTPSFSVNPAKGFFKCFGCGKGGNVYTFLMEIEGLSFPEAVKEVAEQVGVALPEPIDDEDFERSKVKRAKQKELADQVIELNDYALNFWEDHLNDNNPQSKAARDYLAKRELDDETIKSFRIGYAPDTWDTILNLLKAKGASEDLIKQSGLVAVNEEKDRVYDRFRGRIIFPVLDLNSKPVAFGARILGHGEPKYLNSPETPAYIKGQHLYGLFQSKEEIRKKKFVILVEGYMDLVALYQFGIRNVVASLGTAFTPEQAKLMGRFARKVVVNYDGDSAGVKAAQRAIDTLLRQDFDIKVLVLPDGADPDDFIRSNGADRYNLQRGNAYPYLQFVLEQTVKERNLSLPKQKAEAIEEVLPLLASVQNPIQKRESFDQAMTFLRLDDLALKRDLWKTIKLGANFQPEAIKKHVARATQAKMTIAEHQLLELLIHDEKLRKAILPQIEVTDYEMLATAAIFEALFKLQSTDTEVTRKTLLELTGEDTIAQDLVPIIMLGEPAREADEAIDEVLIDAENCLASLRSMAISRRILEISQELAIAEQNSDSESLGRLVNEQIELAKLKRELQHNLSEEQV